MKKFFFSVLVFALPLVGFSANKLDFSGFKQVFPDATDGSEYLYKATYHDYDYNTAVALIYTGFLWS